MRAATLAGHATILHEASVEARRCPLSCRWGVGRGQARRCWGLRQLDRCMITAAHADAVASWLALPAHSRVRRAWSRRTAVPASQLPHIGMIKDTSLASTSRYELFMATSASPPTYIFLPIYCEVAVVYLLLSVPSSANTKRACWSASPQRPDFSKKSVETLWQC